jgi:hypothetical protein
MVMKHVSTMQTPIEGSGEAGWARGAEREARESRPSGTSPLSLVASVEASVADEGENGERMAAVETALAAGAGNLGSGPAPAESDVRELEILSWVMEGMQGKVRMK